MRKIRGVKAVLAILLAALIFVFGGCSFLNKPKTFTKDELSITLTKAFLELNDMGFEYSFISYNMVVLCSKDGFSMASEMKDWTEQDYAEEFISSNALVGCVAETSEDGYAYVEYSGEYDDVSYLYCATIHKTSNAFWLIQFGCLSEDYERVYDDIVKYAKSITFTDKPMVNV